MSILFTFQSELAFPNDHTVVSLSSLAEACENLVRDSSHLL